MPNPLVFPLLRWARRLRFPRLLAVTGSLFALTLVIPDPLPLVDELLLGLATLVLVNWKRDRAERAAIKRSGGAPASHVRSEDAQPGTKNPPD